MCDHKITIWEYVHPFWGGESLEWESSRCEVGEVQGKGMAEAEQDESLAVVPQKGFRCKVTVNVWLPLDHFSTSNLLYTVVPLTSPRTPNN